MRQTRKSGFSLIELIVVIAIIGILASVIYVTFNQGSATGRDAKRQSDLRSLQVAVDLYKQKYGRYPAQGLPAQGCVGAFASESNCSEYITGITPEFMSRLPRDSRRGTNPGYSYRTNTDGTVYKLVVGRTVESETVASGHPFYSCSEGLVNCGGTTCATTADNSYALWGGFAIDASAAGGVDEFAPNFRATLDGLSSSDRDDVLQPTSAVICAQP